MAKTSEVEFGVESETSSASKSTGAPDFQFEKRVMVVDDDPTSVQLLIRYLKPWTNDVEVAFSGAEAIQKLREEGPENFELIISDIRMPFGTGIDLLHELESTVDLPIVLMSSLGKVAREQAEALGAFAFMEKPLCRESLGFVMSRLAPVNRVSTQTQDQASVP